MSTISSQTKREQSNALQVTVFGYFQELFQGMAIVELHYVVKRNDGRIMKLRDWRHACRSHLWNCLPIKKKSLMFPTYTSSCRCMLTNQSQFCFLFVKSRLTRLDLLRRIPNKEIQDLEIKGHKTLSKILIAIVNQNIFFTDQGNQYEKYGEKSRKFSAKCWQKVLATMFSSKTEEILRQKTCKREITKPRVEPRFLHNKQHHPNKKLSQGHILKLKHWPSLKFWLYLVLFSQCLILK